MDEAISGTAAQQAVAAVGGRRDHEPPRLKRKPLAGVGSMEVMPSKTFAWVLTSLSVVTFVGIGGLQMYRVNLGWVTSYGADVLFPFLFYFWLRLGKTVVWNRPLGARPSFLLVLAGCFTWEWSQAYDFEGTPLAIAAGTFDPADFAAYLLGVVTAVAVDPRRRRGEEFRHAPRPAKLGERTARN